jgi:hypothetical protein
MLLRDHAGYRQSGGNGGCSGVDDLYGLLGVATVYGVGDASSQLGGRLGRGLRFRCMCLSQNWTTLFCQADSGD